MVMVSCETDPGTGGGGDPTVGPDINASTTAGILTPGKTFQVSISATAGDGEINTLTILENGVQVDPSRIVVIIGLAAVNNPALLFDGGRASFNYDVTMAASTQAGDQTISF